MNTKNMAACAKWAAPYISAPLVGGNGMENGDLVGVDGLTVGCTVGTAVGKVVGCNVAGNTVGKAVGCTVGGNVGENVGVKVGEGDGTRVGDKVGCNCVGAIDGSAVGVVGETVGDEERGEPKVADASVSSKKNLML